MPVIRVRQMYGFFAIQWPARHKIDIGWFEILLTKKIFAKKDVISIKIVKNDYVIPYMFFGNKTRIVRNNSFKLGQIVCDYFSKNSW